MQTSLAFIGGIDALFLIIFSNIFLRKKLIPPFYKVVFALVCYI